MKILKIKFEGISIGKISLYNNKDILENICETDYVYLNVWLNENLSEIKTSKV
jgi:hypothetical protein